MALLYGFVATAHSHTHTVTLTLSLTLSLTHTHTLTRTLTPLLAPINTNTDAIMNYQDFRYSCMHFSCF